MNWIKFYEAPAALLASQPLGVRQYADRFVKVVREGDMLVFYELEVNA